jgi:hypothetical protein
MRRGLRVLGNDVNAAHRLVGPPFASRLRGRQMTQNTRQLLRSDAAKALARAVLVVAAVSCVFPHGALALPKIAAEHFDSVRSCECHGEQQSDWARSMHAKALYDPVYVLEKGLANADSGGTLGQFCDTCHTPIGTMAGQTAPGKTLSPQSKEGVTCDFCHQVTGTNHPVGGASQTLKANGKKRAQIRNATAPTHVNVYSAFHKSAEFCGACHNLKHPTTGAVLDSTYDDWKAGPYAQAGIVCQDCHMSQGPGAGAMTGRAAPMGPIRSNIYLMTFAGANVALGNPERARANLMAAASVTVAAPEILGSGESGNVTITVTNVGAGHSIPAGASEIRQMWLEVSAVWADGTRQLLGKRQFGTVHKDSKGHYPAPIWEAAGIQSDDRIPPKGSVSESYAFTMNDVDSVDVEAVLNYRSFPDEIAKKAGVANPVTEMARSSAVVWGSTRARNKAQGKWLGLPPAVLIAVLAAVLAVVAGILVLIRKRRSRKA